VAKTAEPTRIRLGQIERLILDNLRNIKVPNDKIYCMSRENAKYRRIYWAGMVPLLVLRNHIYGIELVGPSERAAFSRAVKSLERKGLVKTRNDVSDKNYRTHISLNVNNPALPQLLTPKERPPRDLNKGEPQRFFLTPTGKVKEDGKEG